MIVVDASALLAVLFEEPEGEAFKARMLAGASLMSPVNFWEALVRAQARDGASGRESVQELAGALNLKIASIDEVTATLAAAAFARFGKRSAAGLNLGDCFAYALAKQYGAALLYKGNDFTKTDIPAA